MMSSLKIMSDGLKVSVDNGITWSNIGKLTTKPIELRFDDLSTEQDFDYESLHKYFDFINKSIKEEKNMNKVLGLYKEREEKRITDKYTKLREDMYNAVPVVKEFKELEEKTKQSYEELCNKYNTDTNRVINRTGYSYESGYELYEDIMGQIYVKNYHQISIKK